MKTKTLIVVLLDESGSMAGKSPDVVGGFNSFIDSQKAIAEDEGRMLFIKFNTAVSVVFDSMKLDHVPPLNETTYRPGGNTALYDAISIGVDLADKQKLPDERVICVILTDGEENSSRKTTLAMVKDLIAKRESVGNWTFTYIGENPDEWSRETGTKLVNTVSFDQTDTGANFHSAGYGCSGLRTQSDGQSSELFR